MTVEPTTDLALSNHDFTLPSRSHVQATLQQVEEFRALIQSELREGPDYGTIPGTSKPTLLKPGAEKITKLLGLTCSNCGHNGSDIHYWNHYVGGRGVVRIALCDNIRQCWERYDRQHNLIPKKEVVHS